MYFVTGPDGLETGPVSVETLRGWVASGQLPPEAPVRSVGSEPIRADQVAELKALYSKPAPDQTFGGLIPTGNPAALWGYYLGFGALVPVLGALAVPFCVAQSIAGIKAYKNDPSIRGMTHSVVGLLLGFVGLAIQVVVIALLITMVTAGRQTAVP